MAGLVGTFFAATLIAGFPRVWLILPLFAFVIAPALLFNSMFHVGASVLTRSYCPGTISALFLYLPLIL
jgi:hypothetical protein